MIKLTWILFGAILLIVYSCAESKRRTGSSSVATDTLEANRLLQRGDVGLAGGPFYLRRKIEKGEPIDADDLAQIPSLQPPAGTLMIGLPVHVPVRSPAGADRRVPRAALPVNAGDHAAICPSAANLAAPVSVLSVLCTPDGAECTALVAATPQQTGEIVRARQAGTSLTVGASCG